MNEVEFLVPEFEYHPKGALWHLIFGLLAVGLGAISWFLKNYTFMALIAVIWIAIIIRQVKRPALISFRISDGKIILGNKTWDYKEIKNFSILEIGSKKNLILVPLGKLRVAVKIPITDSEQIMEKLNNYVPQVEYEESLLEIAARRLNI